ncbi:probable LRR receptor-like serine/threonine-protein kinase At1g67720 isoform X2 [Cryptomeria japonica]|uniref:probable LRR receptor-like serine/threonine-protein kinase At1g67720 isoform X2 n=1 Tax=Cryptomeria japonica TaxID=3369 RepID=UPI0027D9EF6A|nr:probable LRR receptor-like serine/threonine-protein kinase At1g67720 isoform X2 [Cryptomeria japonica]
MEASACALFLIISWSVYSCLAESGFLSLDCGGIGNLTDSSTGITWTPDDKYIQGGYRKANNDQTLEFYHQSLRVFPKPLNKSCYHLPITPNVPFLLRLYFVGVRYTNLIPNFNYSIETQEFLSLRKATFQRNPPQRSEKILVSGGQVLYICLIRASEDVDPFISSIELRPLRQGMYNQVKSRSMLHMRARNSYGASKQIRHPDDQFDRMWDPDVAKELYNVSSVEPISTNNTEDLPPSVVMQTAVAVPANDSTVDLDFINSEEETLLLLYFAEIENTSGSRIFDINIDGETKFTGPHLVRNHSAIEVPILIDRTLSLLTLSKTSNSTMSPILNALEWYERVTTAPLTSSEDVQALASVKKIFNLSNWNCISDPCFIYPWEGINCNNGPEIVRVLEIDLSNRNLTGSIPSTLGNMTALVKLSLDNNHLTGGLPDLSKLVILERLHLQNNDLSGDVPDWLSELPNLKELFIGNNNFSGVIPQKLQDLNLLELTYEGNNYLCVRKEECRLSSHSHGRRGKTVSVPVVVCPIAIAGIISLLGIIIYRKKFGRKEIANSGTQGTPTGNRESRYVPGQDNLIISVPSTPKSRSFSLEEMMTATKNFSSKIGQGGFGSVFLGELAEGKQIAVKILSFFSEQGIAQFLNEIELLSRAHHRNLVCLLGYCNASRDLMLVYEYMSGGSLNDHLYGRNKSKYPKLGWKSRLKIALHAAQGLEYLRTNCTPKIIHRDIKTANILLDANLTGKLADFGLSRVAADDVSHVITAVRGTAGYVDPKEK